MLLTKLFYSNTKNAKRNKNIFIFLQEVGNSECFKTEDANGLIIKDYQGFHKNTKLCDNKFLLALLPLFFALMYRLNLKI
ncbi:hypothetical protein EV194_10690 [Natronoflexus pectinivorans]|uniref:Uncharacterized protein n=1 Tax=Natronoflexus pectinivorans TaxID=682526 RepID=A0A4R2GKN3_9BACT|nr:hypothetical protein EV194_10690 [Natronoflexus pectinivorans]